MNKNIVYFLRPRNIINLEKDFESVAHYGISSVVIAQQMGEFNMLVKEDFRKALNIFSKLGLKTPASHGVIGEKVNFNQPDKNDIHNVLEKHQIFMANSAEAGCLTYVTHLGPKYSGYSEAFLWDQVRRTLDKLIPFAEKQGLIIALENANPGHLGDDSKKLVEIAAEFSSPFLGLCFDSGHAHRAENEIAVFNNMAPFLRTCHIHDNDKSADQHLIPGHGTINWDLLIPKIIDCNNLIHIETESFNTEGWPHDRIFEHYQKLFRLPVSIQPAKVGYKNENKR